MTEEKMTKYEKARIIGSRALQIAMGAPFLVELKPDDLENRTFEFSKHVRLVYPVFVFSSFYFHFQFLAKR